MSNLSFKLFLRLLFGGLFLGVDLGVRASSIGDFTTLNGQILTPGLAIVDSPRPFTPEGGDFLQVALDITNDGRISLPPYDYGNDFETGIFNITMFLSSYSTGLNLTITNGTASAGNASLGNILFQEPGSTVKHVNWNWPSCLVGNGEGGGSRGDYNITIQQNFRLNGTDFYTIFFLPISVTNSIPDNSDRPSCEELNNPLLADPLNGTSTAITASFMKGSGVDTTARNGFGKQKPLATPQDGLGSGASRRRIDVGIMGVALLVWGWEFGR